MFITTRRFIPPFDDPLIIQGQGTVGMEILRQVNSGQELDAIFVPVGGGGLIAGIASYVKQLRPNIKVWECHFIAIDNKLSSVNLSLQALKNASAP